MAIPIIAPFPKRSPFPSPRNKKIKYLYFPEGFLGEVRLSKNLYNEKGRPPYPYKSAKSRDLCVAFCTSQGASVRQRRAYSPLQKLEKVA